MKNVVIEVSYRGEIYNSEVKQVTDVELVKLRNTAAYAVSGDIDHLEITNGHKKYFFGKKILQESIITIREFSKED